MFKIDIIPAKGTISSLSTTSHKARVINPGSTVKIALAKGNIAGVKKIGDNLIILQKEGEEITIEQFFRAGEEKNTLVIDDDGVLYQAQYDGENFAGMHFSKNAGTENVVHEEADAPLAGWVVPAVLGVAGVAGAGAIIAHQSRSGKSASADGGKNDENLLTQTQRELTESKSVLDQATLQAEAALKALSDTPGSATQTAATHADSALKSAVTAYQQSYQRLSDVVKAAAAKGVDTNSAQLLLKQMGDAFEGSASLSGKLTAAQKAVTALLTMQGMEIGELISQAQTAASLAKTYPNQANLDAAAEKLAALKASGAPLNETLQQAVAMAESLGVQTASIKAAGEALYQNVLTEIEQALSKARENLEAIDAANTAIAQANAALSAAQQARAEAEEKAGAALKAKQQALENNQHDRVEAVNKAIKEANQLVEKARTAAAAANELVAKANKYIDKIDAEVADKPGYLDPVAMDGLDRIGKGVAEEQPKTFLEALSDFGKNMMAVVTDIAERIKDSTLVEMLTDVLNKTGETLGGVPGMIWDMVSSPFAAISAATKSIIKLFTEAKGDIWDVITTVVDAIKDITFTPFTEVAKGIMTGLSDALAGMGWLYWINPIKWVGLVKNVVANSFHNAVEALWKAIAAIPGKVIDAIGEVTGKIAEGVKEEIAIIKKGIQDVIDVFFEAFLKNPFELFVKPLFDKVSDIISDPFGFIKNITTTTETIFKEGADILKSIFEAPEKMLDIIKELFNDIVKNFSAGKVIEGSIDDVVTVIESDVAAQASPEESSGERSNNAEIKEIYNSLADKNGDVNLDKLGLKGDVYVSDNNDLSVAMTPASVLHEELMDSMVIS